MPRDPLLGRNDPPAKKRLNAFTTKAETENFDIGKPPPSGIVKKPKPSVFRTELDEGHLPLTRDHSGSINKIEIIWKENYLDIDLNEMFPKIIEGFMDPRMEYAAVADVAALDLLKHCKPDDLIGSIPHITPVLKQCLQSGLYLPIRRVMKFLISFVTLIDDVAIYLIPYMQMLLMYIQMHCMNTKDMGAHIYYAQVNHPLLHAETETFLQKIVESAGSKQYEMAQIIKRIIPSFTSPLLN